jgi:(2Fe-2S) ferredoxin
MRSALTAPCLHLFVCANRRPLDSPLGPGCANSGEVLYDALKEEVSSRRQFADVWVTKTSCLGICPREGATVIAYPLGHVFTEAFASEASAFYERELAAVRAHRAGR